MNGPFGKWRIEEFLVSLLEASQGDCHYGVLGDEGDVVLAPDEDVVVVGPGHQVAHHVAEVDLCVLVAVRHDAVHKGVVAVAEAGVVGVVDVLAPRQGGLAK